MNLWPNLDPLGCNPDRCGNQPVRVWYRSQRHMMLQRRLPVEHKKCSIGDPEKLEGALHGGYPRNRFITTPTVKPASPAAAWATTPSSAVSAEQCTTYQACSIKDVHLRKRLTSSHQKPVKLSTASQSRINQAMASFSESTYTSPLTSTTTLSISPPRNTKGGI